VGRRRGEYSEEAGSRTTAREGRRRRSMEREKGAGEEANAG